MTGIEFEGKKGMIGNALMAFLKEKGVTVVPFHGDIRDEHAWNKYDLTRTYGDGQIDMLIHLAALAGVRPSMEMPDVYWDNNVNGAKNAFNFAKRNGIKCLWASSSNAYEWWTNAYAATKRACEQLAEDFHDNIGMRFHTVWPGRDDMLFKRMKAGEDLIINAHHTRDWIHIEDLCEAIWTLITNWQDVRDEHKIVDIGNGIEYNVSEVYDKYATKPPAMRTWNSQHERIHTKANIDWLKKLGWTPKYSIL